MTDINSAVRANYDKKGVLFSTEFPPYIKNIEETNISLSEFISQWKGDGESEVGLIKCPYYTVKIYSGKSEAKELEMSAYSFPLFKQQLFSFGFITLSEDMFPITVTLKAKDDYVISSAKVIPEKLSVNAVVEQGETTFEIKNFGQFTVLFNGGENEFLRPLTIFVKRYKEYSIDKSFKIIEFKKGFYELDRILNCAESDGLDDKTVVYLHSGAFIKLKKPTLEEKYCINCFGNKVWGSFIRAQGKKDVYIVGDGIIDFSALPLHARAPFEFISCNNVTIDGVTAIGAASWTFTLRDCVNVNINDIIGISYRINSDGVAICNCKDALIQNSFMCSGDDLFQVKSYHSLAENSETGGHNITFRNCQAWAVKTRCFGFIQESERDVDGILYEDCSAIYHDADFTMTDSFTSMGAFVVVVGDTATIKNVAFKNCDAYTCKAFAINIVLADNFWTINKEKGCLGRIENVSFSNMRFKTFGKGIQIVNKKLKDRAKNDLSGISFSDIYIDGKRQQNYADFLNKITFLGDADKDCVSSFNGKNTFHNE